MAPLANDGSVWLKLIVETTGRAPPEGQRVRKLPPVGETTVTLSDTAFAELGTPHRPRTVKSRCMLVLKIGPPFVEFGLRVSTILHGATAKNWNGPVWAVAETALNRAAIVKRT